jgi:hypothetical protein
VFERTVVPRDFDIVELPYRERGEPTLIRWKDARARVAANAAPVEQPG